MKKIFVFLGIFLSNGALAQEYSSSDSSVMFRKVWSVRMNDAAPGDHTSNNEAAEFSPNGKLLAVGCGDATIRVVSIPDGEIVKTIKLWDGPLNPKSKATEVEVVYWTPDGKYIVAAGNKILPAVVVHYKSGKVVKTLVQSANQDALTLSHNGEYMAVAADDEVVVYRTSDWTQVKRLKPTNDGDLNSFEFSPDDKYLATGGNKGHVGLISVPDFEVVNDLHEGGGYIKSVRFSPDSKYIIRTSHLAFFELWSIDGKLLKKVDQPEYMEAVSFHPDGDILVVGGKDLHYQPGEYPIKVYSFPELEHLLDIPNDGENVEYLDITADGKYMAQPSTTGNVILWEIIKKDNPPSFSRINREVEQFSYELGTIKSDASASEGKYLDMKEFGSVTCDLNLLAGNYNLTFWIRSPKQDLRNMGLFVNGEKIDILKTTSLNWEACIVKDIPLLAGSNRIEIKDSEGEGKVHGDELDIDRIDIELVSAESDFGSVDLPENMADSSAEVVPVLVGLQTSEGCIVDEDGNLFFTEGTALKSAKIWKITPEGHATVFVDSANGSNGLALDPHNRLVSCQIGRLVRYNSKGEGEAIVTEDDGFKLELINDIFIGKDGSMYFTNFRGNSYFFRNKEGDVTEFKTKMANGIEWVEEEGIVYMGQEGLKRFEIADDHSLINETKLAGHGVDGITLDELGNIYTASWGTGQVIVHAPNGEKLGSITIKTPRVKGKCVEGPQGNVANCIFGGPEHKTLYIVGDGGLYKVEMKVKGRIPTVWSKKTGNSSVEEEGRFLYAHKGFEEDKPLYFTGSEYKLHQIDRPQPLRVIPPESAIKIAPPSDATILFDGTSMDQFNDNPEWEIKGGSIVAGKKFLTTKESYGDCQLHVEWRTPNPPRVKQGLGVLGNSGVVLMSLYEVQVYDSYTAKIYPDGSAASVYGQTPPLVNACRAPGKWQSYDIIFKAPVFKGKKLVKPAQVTVLHNGVLVQNNTKILGPTAHRRIKDYKTHEAKRPLSFKGENTPVEYRNIWIRK